MRKLYFRIRGRALAAEIPVSVLVREGWYRLPGLLRGAAMGLSYGNTGLGHIRGRSVVVSHPKWLSVGKYCVFGSNITIACFGFSGVVLGDFVTIANGAHLGASGVIAEPGVGISVGARTSIGAYNVIWGQGGVTIGEGCLLGPNVVIVSEDHEFADSSLEIRLQGHRRGAIIIGNDCWLGSGVVVTRGVTIGDGCVIGANSVVTMDLPPYSVAVGAPARVVSVRGS